MPATFYTWSIDDKPIFQVYGTKRKVVDDGNNEETNNEKVEHKRRCIESRDECDDEMNEYMDDISDGESLQTVSKPTQLTDLPNMISMNQLSHNSNMVRMNDRVPPLPNTVIDSGASGFYNNNNNNIICPESMSSQQLNYSQNDMIMDLNDEVYSTTQWPVNVQTDAEYEAACNMVATMEAEGAPDPYQYTNTFQSTKKSLVEETSPRLNQSVGQYSSKPERLQDVIPYVSDYY